MDVSAKARIGDQHVLLHAQVLAELRSQIIRGSYRPGERLTEDRLADDFGVSRNPVREALRVLDGEGFVRVIPRKGAVVAVPDSQLVDELFHIRTMLEPFAAELVASRISDAQLDELKQIVDHSREATEQRDYARLTELNSVFHQRIVELSGNRWLRSVGTSIYQHVQWVFRLGAVGRAPHSWVEHLQMIEALGTRDPKAARRAAERHVQAAYDAAAELGHLPA